MMYKTVRKVCFKLESVEKFHVEIMSYSLKVLYYKLELTEKLHVRTKKEQNKSFRFACTIPESTEKWWTIRKKTNTFTIYPLYYTSLEVCCSKGTNQFLYRWCLWAVGFPLDSKNLIVKELISW